MLRDGPVPSLTADCSRSHITAGRGDARQSQMKHSEHQPNRRSVQTVGMLDLYLPESKIKIVSPDQITNAGSEHPVDAERHK